MKRLVVFLMVIGLWCCAVGAQANTFNFTGNINYNTDVVYFNFNLANDATNVRVWTDSFQNGANFDPITALWTATGNLIAQNDDNSSIGPNQTYWDSGFQLATLNAGNYIFTVAAYNNFAAGSTLAQGFGFDGTTPVPITQWWENAPGYYSVWFDGVDQANNNNVPIPGAVWLLGSGLLGMGAWRRLGKV